MADTLFAKGQGKAILGNIIVTQKYVNISNAHLLEYIYIHIHQLTPSE
jgi:hypothetical protein